MRERATVLLVRHQSVLLVRERGGPWLLPGGTVGYEELTIIAAIRALHEDTGVAASAAAFCSSRFRRITCIMFSASRFRTTCIRVLGGRPAA